MKAFCTNCLTNWAALHSQDGEGDETYEYCPLCRTDSYLEEAHPGDAYIMCAVTGNLINFTTRKIKPDEIKPVIPKPERIFDLAAWQAQRDEKERQNEADIIAYQEVYERKGREEAEQYYFELRRKKLNSIL